MFRESVCPSIQVGSIATHLGSCKESDSACTYHIIVSTYHACFAEMCARRPTVENKRPRPQGGWGRGRNTGHQTHTHKHESEDKIGYAAAAAGTWPSGKPTSIDQSTQANGKRTRKQSKLETRPTHPSQVTSQSVRLSLSRQARGDCTSTRAMPCGFLITALGLLFYFILPRARCGVALSPDKPASQTKTKKNTKQTPPRVAHHSPTDE